MPFTTVIVKVFIPGLKKPEIDVIIQFGCREEVGTEHDAVLVFDKEVPGCVQLPSKLADSGGRIHIHVWIAVEAAPYKLQVLRGGRSLGIIGRTGM
jgi:hypothetical protein